ncbi:MAG: DUF3418 domain-containing protein, partial [Propionibacteriaceae bacterium]|nr:DUF3418 domain-containing protein [Propionibacteriaceae bacterium]
LAAIRDLAAPHHPWSIRDEPSFTALVTKIRPDQVETTFTRVKTAAAALTETTKLRANLAPHPPYLVADITHQLDNLIFNGFLTATPTQWLARIPTWLRGASMRLDQASRDPNRDETRMDQLDPILDAYDALLSAHPDPHPDIVRIAYLIEEFRLQLFAQTLRTVETVSPKRIMKAIAEVG